MPVAHQETYWTPKEVAQRFRVSEETIRRYIRNEELKAVRVGTKYRITEGAIQDFLSKKPKD